MRVPRFLACAATAALAVTGSVLVAASPASASGSPYCPSNVPVNGTVSGTVYAGTDDWYYSDAIGPKTFTLTPFNGDADLRVFGADCSTVLCSSTASGTATDSCTTTEVGRVYVRVYYYSGSGSINYTLSGPAFAPILPDPTGYPSDDCLYGTTLAEGFAAGNYVRVRAASAGSNETWICVRAEGPSLTAGGKFVVTGAGFSLPALPSTDTNVTACATQGGNTVPGPHPLLKGQLGDPGDPSTYVPFLIDSWAGNGDAWVCVGAGDVKVRAKVSTGASVTTPNVAFHQDLPGSHTSQPPILYVPSGQCQAAGTSGVTRYLDVTSAGLRTYLYTWQATPTVFKVCVRTQGLANAGGVLSIDTTNLGGSLPNVTTGSDNTGCPFVVARLDQPTVLELRRSSTSDVPASICATVGTRTVRVTASTGNGGAPANVTWSPDPGTP